MRVLIVFLISIIAISSGYLISHYNYTYLLGVSVSFILAILAFYSPKMSLLFLVFSMLLSPEMKLAQVASNRALVIRYDDIFLIIIFFSWFFKNAFLKTRPFIFKTPLQTPLLIYTSVFIFSSFLGILNGYISYYKAAFYVLKYIEYYLLYFMAVNILQEEKDFSVYLKYGWLVLLAVVIYSYFYYYNATGTDIRATAPFEAPLNEPKEAEPASLGGYYLIALSFLMAYASQVSGRMLIFSIFTMFLVYHSLLLTFSRASYMGVIASFLAFLIFSKRGRLFFITLSFLGLIITLLSPVSQRVENRIKSTYTGIEANRVIDTPFGELKLEESAYLRYNSLRRVITEVLPENLLFGRGVTGIGLGDNQYALVLGETGLIGFFVFLWLIYSILKFSYGMYKLNHSILINSLSLGVFCATIGFLFQGFGVNTFIIVRIMEPYWFAISILSAVYIQQRDNKDFSHNR
jgi:hypothetical protein